MSFDARFEFFGVGNLRVNKKIYASVFRLSKTLGFLVKALAKKSDFDVRFLDQAEFGPKGPCQFVQIEIKSPLKILQFAKHLRSTLGLPSYAKFPM